MKTFAIDCHSNAASVAILDNNTLLYECTLFMQTTHSETLLKLCDDAFSSTELKPDDINLFAIANGPGSFTGLRIGLSLVKAMAFSNSALCAGVSSLKALANSLPINGYIAACIDARRDELYCALFKQENGVITQVIEDGALSCEEFLQKTKNFVKQSDIITAIGDGAKKLCEHSNKFVMPEDTFNLCKAGCIAKLAINDYNNGKAVTSNLLLPSYLKLSQAERQFIKKEFK